MLATLLATASTTSKSSSSSSSLIFLVILVAFVGLYFHVLRPRTRRARQQASGNRSLAVGDEVVSAGGILGRVTAIVGDEIEVEVSPGTTLTFWRRAVNLRTSVPGAPQSRSAAPAEESYDGDSYQDEPYEEETYDEVPAEGDDDDEAAGGYGSVAPAGEERETGNGASAYGQPETEVHEADHRDSSGGSGEGN